MDCAHSLKTFFNSDPLPSSSSPKIGAPSASKGNTLSGKCPNEGGGSKATLSTKSVWKLPLAEDVDPACNDFLKEKEQLFQFGGDHVAWGDKGKGELSAQQSDALMSITSDDACGTKQDEVYRSPNMFDVLQEED